VILNLDSYVYFAPEVLPKLAIKAYLTPNVTELCFRVTEPSLDTFVPKVSEPKLAVFHSLTDNLMELQLREDFRITDEEMDQHMIMLMPDKYLGDGIYRLTLTEIVGLYIKIEDTSIREDLAHNIKELQ
jgi:hypothetical protein